MLIKKIKICIVKRSDVCYTVGINKKEKDVECYEKR